MRSYKEDFPLLRNSSIAYLDNAATAQRPEAVLNAEREFYEKYNANPLRGLYQLGMDATDCYEKARETVRDFIHAKKSSEIIFTRNTTESINLVAYSYALNKLKPGDAASGGYRCAPQQPASLADGSPGHGCKAGLSGL